MLSAGYALIQRIIVLWLGTLYLEEKEISVGNWEVGELSNVDVPKTIEAEVEEKCTLPLHQAALSSTTSPSSSRTGLHEAVFVPPLTSIPQNLSVPPCTGLGLAQPDNVARSQPPQTLRSISHQSNNIPPPMEVSSFERSFKTFCVSEKLNIDLQQLQIDNKPINLYQLHRNVMLEFGFAMVIDSTLIVSLQLIALTQVEQKKLWDVIGARMGFVQISGTGTEPAKSGSDIAHRLANIYKEYLFIFEQRCVAQAILSRPKVLEQVEPTQVMQAPPPGSIQRLSSGQGSLRSAGLHCDEAVQRVSRNLPQLPDANQNVTKEYPPPLDRPRFQQLYTAYCARKKRKNDIPPQIDNKPVDLYQLHRNVMLESGFIQVFIFPHLA